MPSRTEVVITGVGVVCPIGIGKEAYWSALCERKSGVRFLRAFDASALPVQLAAEVSGFDPGFYVRPRKNLKLMSRDAQLGMAAAELCRQDAQLSRGDMPPERLGALFGADPVRTPLADCLPAYRHAADHGRFLRLEWLRGAMECYPLTLLHNLPNMISTLISIAMDARGPNNTIFQGDVSGLLAIGEAARIVERGAADAIVAGGASSRLHPFDWARSCLYEQLSRRVETPAAASRPFDAARDGQVRGEGAAAYMVESLAHARRRGANVLARVLGWASTSEPRANGKPACSCALRRAMISALRDAGLSPADVGHVNAHGLSTVNEDRIEAQTIRDVCGAVPVTAPKSYFGNLGAAGGAVEMAASVLSLAHGLVPATLNYDRPDPACPVNVVSKGMLPGRPPVALVVNRTTLGQCVAMVLAAAE